jgi:hypothetical protein
MTTRRTITGEAPVAEREEMYHLEPFGPNIILHKQFQVRSQALVLVVKLGLENKSCFSHGEPSIDFQACVCHQKRRRNSRKWERWNHVNDFVGWQSTANTQDRTNVAMRSGFSECRF